MTMTPTIAPTKSIIIGSMIVVSECNGRVDLVLIEVGDLI